MIETHYGTDSGMGQEGNRDPSRQGKKTGAEGIQGRELETVVKDHEETVETGIVSYVRG